jgi:phage portal protein BeeE
MMMRAVGKGGVSWIQMGVSQKDMEFLQGRTFNKEEIFAALAPGLSSMLAVNATEANSKAGKATFNEMTIWPMHQAVAEKFTADILPAYGETLVGEF